MKITLLLLCCLLITVNCQGYTCSYENNNVLIMIKDVEASSRLTCNFVIASVSVSPVLPTGMTINTEIGEDTTGLISGTPTYASAQSSYTVSVGRRGSSDVIRVVIQVAVISPLTSCTYNVRNALFMINYPNSLMPPTCDSITSSFTADGLPTGMEIDPTTGAITGTAALAGPANDQTATITVTGIRGGGTATVTLKYSIIDPSSSEASQGILARFAYGQTAWSNTVYPTYMKKFEDGSINHYTNVFEQPTYTCPLNDPCIQVGGNIGNMYGKWTAALNFEKTGDYVFSYRSDDNAVIYIDDMNINKGEPTPSWNQARTYTMSVSTPGYKAFAVLHFNGGNANDLIVQWKTPGSTAFATIPKANLRYVPSPVTKLEYPAKFYSLNIGQSKSIDGIYIGYCPSIEVTPDLSKIGVSVLSSGKLTTTAAIDYNNGAYNTFTFKCKSTYSGYDDFTSVLNIRVIKVSKEYAMQGLLGNYYKTTGRNDCKFIDINNQYHSLAIQKITTSDSDIWHATTNEIWDGLSSDFANDYDIRWTGYLYVEKAGSYMFSFTVQDGGRLYVTANGGQYTTLEDGCKLQSNDLAFNLVEGLNYFSVRYTKGHTSPLKTLEVQYTGPGVTKKMVPHSALYHMPSLAFEYEYMRNDYVSGVEMAKNCPLFAKADENKYNYFSITPNLPDGININSQTGCISGTPSVAMGNFSLTTFNIQACKSQGSNECLESSISIEAHAYQAPSGLTYPNSISGEIGMQVLLKPTYVSSTAVKWSSNPALPKGLSFDADGTILGNPVEEFSGTVTVSCSNPSGASTYELSITIRGCANGNLVYLKYITGDKDLTMNLYKVTSTGVAGVLYAKEAKDHSFNTYYAFFTCSEISDLRLEMNFEGQLGGTYIVGGEDDVIFKKGSWNYDNPSSAVQFSIEKGDTPELSYRSNEFTYVIGEEISIKTNPIKYGASSFSVPENSLPLGVLFNTTTGEFSGYALVGAENKNVTVTAYGRGGESSSSVTISFRFNEYCQDGYSLLSVEGIMTNYGEDQMMQLTGKDGVILNYQNGFPSYSSFRWSQCLPFGTYKLTYGMAGSKKGRSGRYYIYKNNVNIAYLTVVYDGRTTYTIDLFTYIDVATQWEYSFSASGNWHQEYGGDSDWKKCTINTLPDTKQTTTYYRAKFSLAYVDFAAISRFELTLSYRDGIVVYLNGQQLYIRNMGSSASDTSFSSSTLATSQFASMSSRTIYGSNQRLNQGDNYIGIEIHKKEAGDKANAFTISLSISIDSSNNCQNVLPVPSSETQSNYYNNKAAYADYGANEGFSKAFDSNVNTKYLYDEGDQYLVFRYWIPKGGAYTIDQYLFASANDHPCRDPYNWVIEGARQFDTTDGEGSNPFWETIAAKTDGFGYEGTISGIVDELPETRKKYFYFPVTANKKYAYEALRIGIKNKKSGIASCPNQIQFSEFNLLVCRQASCPQDGLWPATLAGDYAEIECESGYDGNQRRECDSTGNWNDNIDRSGCLKKPDATQLNYDFINPVKAYIGANMKYTPNPNGEVTGYSISPRLPTGVSIDANTGIIKGAATEKVSNQIYTITATTTTNPVSQVLQLTVDQPVCASQTVEGILYPETLAGNSINIRCGGEYSGSATVTCSLVNGNPIWTSPDRSKCLSLPPPGCQDITGMTFKVGDLVNKVITCTRAVVDYTIHPSLPTGISLNVLNVSTGSTISFTGRASVALSPTTYVLNVTSERKGYDELNFPLKIYELIKSCSYAFGNSVMQVGQNIETEIFAPTCIGVVDSYMISNEASLPAGLKFDTVTGSITGIATTISPSPVSIIMNAVNPAGNSPQYNLLLQVVEAIMDDGKLDGEVTENGGVSSIGISELMRKWDKGDYAVTKVDMPTSFSTLSGRNSPYEIAYPVRDSSSSVIGKEYYATRFTGYINIPAGGEWQFKIQGDDEMWVFIDDMSVANVMTGSYNAAGTYTKTLQAGYRKLAIYFYNGGTAQYYDIKWRSINAGITDYTNIPDSAFARPTGSILQKVSYATNDFIFVKGLKIEPITPTLVGPVKTWRIEPDLPPGVVFNNGVISGTPTIAYNRREYTITATNVVTVVIKISFGILDNNGNSLSRGVTGYYYSGNVGCDIIDLDKVPKQLTLKFTRYETKGVQFPSSAAVWDGLTNDFKSSFVAYWKGYLNIPEAGDYTFHAEATDWSRLYIASESAYYSNKNTACGSQSRDITIKFENGGLTYFGILFGKAQNSGNKSHSLEWTHDSGNYPFSRKEVDFEYLLHVPEGYLEYTYKLATYVSGIAIKSNEPIFFQVQSSKYNNFLINPLLPSGIMINPSTGVISGTPTDLGVLETTYTITASSSSDASLPTYTTQITFTVEQRFNPQNLVYPTISTSIGQKLTVNGVTVNSVSPSLDNAIGVIYTLKSPLPTGLSLNPNTGEISGIPYEQWSEPVTIEASNPSGSTEAKVSITVTGCPGSMKFLRFEYTIQNADVVVQLMNSRGILLHQGSGLVGFQEYIYTECNTPDMYNVTFTRRGAASGGWFRISMDNLVVYSANNTDGAWTTDAYVVNGNTVNAPPILVYPTPQVNVIPGQIVSLCPSIQNGASRVEIVESGEFPEFLRFSEETGCVVGTTMGMGRNGISITLKAINPSGESSPTTIQIIADQQCPGTKELAVFRFTCDNECPRNYYTFKSFSSSSYVISNAGNILNHDKWMSDCVTLGAYELVVGNSDKHSWTSDTNFYIYLGTQLLDTYRHDSTTVKTTQYVVSLTSYLTDSSEWHFSNSKPNNDKWKSELDKSYMPNKYRSGLFPTRTTIASYYGIEFNFYDELTFISSLDLSVTHDSGIIIYLNGVEIYRNGLPIGLVTETTWGKRLIDPIAARTVVIPQMLIKAGKNYMAVECHRYRSSIAYDPFKASLLPTASSTTQTGKCSLKTTMNGVQAYTSGTTNGGEEASKAIDNNHGTKTYVIHTKEDYPVNFDIYWPNKRAEYFNMYDFWTANDRWEYRNPTGWRVYGSSEYGTNDWELIDTQLSVNLPSANAVQTKFNLNNIYKSYNAFRLQIAGVKQPENGVYGYQMADLLQYNCIPAYCNATEDGKWPSTAAGYTARIACNSTQSGWISRKCVANSDGVTANWENEIAGCQSHATSISYTPTTFKVGFASSVSPTTNGGVNSYYISCSNGLPMGISFESETGILSGIAMIENDNEAKTYSCDVTGTTGDGKELKASVAITVTIVYCNADGTWPQTKAGDSASIACENGYSGNRTRRCSTTRESSWDAEDTSGCKLLPPEFTVSLNDQINTEFAVTAGSTSPLTAAVISGRQVTTWSKDDPQNVCKLTSSSTTAQLTCDTPNVGLYEFSLTADNGDSSYTQALKIQAFTSTGTIAYINKAFTLYKDIEVDCSKSFNSSVVFVSGAVTSLTITPQDYVVSPITGCFKGIPKEVGTKTYTLSINGVAEPITINVQQATCSLPGSGTVPAGEYYSSDCPLPQIGKISRYCPLKYNPTLEDPISTCENPNPTSFSYSISYINAYKNVPITNVVPVIVGNKNNITYSVKSGTLPPGVELNTDGSIGGAPTETKTYSDIVISAFGNQELTTTLTIVVADAMCAAIPSRDLPSGEAGTEVTKPCPEGYNGHIIIRCPYTANPSWGDEDDSGCTTPAPEVWGYEMKDGYVTFSVGFYKSLPPRRTSGGMPTEFSLMTGSSKLPLGITLNKNTGHLQGMSSAEYFPSDIIILGKNNVGQKETKFKIRVVLAVCPEEGEWPETRAGSQAVLACTDSTKVGQRSRYCPNVEDPKWQSPVDTCKVDVPSFQYASKDNNVYWDVPFEVSPTNVQGEPDSYRLHDLSPALPKGLSLDETTGKISGKVSTTVPRGSDVYYVVAHNAQGDSIRQLISLNIETFQCNGEGVWITTDYGSEAAVLCPTGFLGTEVRPCNSFTVSGSVPIGRWGTPNNSSCVAVDDKEIPPPEKVYLKFDMSIPLKSKSDISGLHYQVFQQLVAQSLNSALNASGVIVKPSSVLLDFIDEQTEEGENNLKVEVRIADAEANAKKLTSYFNPNTQLVMEEFNRLVGEGYTDLFGSTFISIDTSGEIEGPTASASGDASTGTNIGMIIGLVVAGAAVLIIVLGCVYCRCISKSVERKKRPTGKKKAAAKADGKDVKPEEKKEAKKDGVRV